MRIHTLFTLLSTTVLTAALTAASPLTILKERADDPVATLTGAGPDGGDDQTYTYESINFTAQASSSACMQDYDLTMSEDCLYLNVYTPSGSSGSDASLPVMVWVFGGGFQTGDAGWFNASRNLQYGVDSGKPFIFVALQYRLGAFGWGTGSGYAENQATNLGLKDIKQGLSWVQSNIAAFGGDPSKVTLFGESAGAMATFTQIMESGAPSGTPLGPAGSTWEDAYQFFLDNVGCKSPSDGSTEWACLKALSADQLLNGQKATKNQTQWVDSRLYGPSIDGDVIPDSPHTLISNGKIANIPFIQGNNKDEGTSFAPTTLDGPESGRNLIRLIEPVPPSNATLDSLLDLYPADPTVGSPYDTGNDTFGLQPAYKRFASIVGDLKFQAPRRHFLREANKHGNTATWTYQFEQSTPGSAAQRGVWHASEIPYVYGLARPGTGQSADYTDVDGALSDAMMEYWINFAHYSDPNGLPGTTSNFTSWPAHDISANTNILRLKGDDIQVFKDDFREEGMQFMQDNAGEFNM
ncbi:hypothetical protein I350_06864 [Cryptococcus amylolentus CBS 6273]|uniref:Carboxylic ester hydrolase n=1 Tax=Cryptococcus amylolentus CBS 6273 TaxID=1296118 RepID=A0A1E3JHW5_9TREE|nr:hypothetical protein I350_06864 [Cryptococcus amylolentus CBS 6273]